MIAMLMMMWNMTMTVLMMIATTETRMLNKRKMMMGDNVGSDCDIHTAATDADDDG